MLWQTGCSSPVGRPGKSLCIALCCLTSSMLDLVLKLRPARQYQSALPAPVTYHGVHTVQLHRAPISYNNHMLQVAWDTWPLLPKPLGVILSAGAGFLLGAGIGGCGVLWNLLAALFAVVEAAWHTAQQGIAALLIADPADRKAAAATAAAGKAAQPEATAAGTTADTAAAAMDPTAGANAVAAADANAELKLAELP
jgi:hypothetical protein